MDEERLEALLRGLAEQVSDQAGRLDGVARALFGVVSALRDTPGVREHVLQELERAYVASLGGSTNPVEHDAVQEVKAELEARLQEGSAGDSSQRRP